MRAERIEGGVLVLILVTVGGLAGAASFTHVHDWTMHNSPAGTGDWFGWANAAISELIPLAALLTIRRRRRAGGPIGYPMFLLVAAVALSLAAQLAVAKPGLSGWLLSAVPALAFLGLSKLVLTVPPGPSIPDTGPGENDDLPEPVPTQVNAEEDQDGGTVATKDQAATGRPISRDQRQIRQPGTPNRALVPVTAYPSRNGNTPAGGDQ